MKNRHNMKYNQVRREEEWLEEPEEICRLAFLSEKILHGRCPRRCEDIMLRMKINIL